MSKKISHLISDIQRRLKEKKKELSQREIEDILAWSLGVSRLELYLYPDKEISPAQEEKLEEILEKRCSGEPLAYIKGFTDFHGISFKVGPGVLIPRPETELLTEEALKWLLKNREKKRFHKEEPALIGDFGSGSGCIGLTLALKFKPCFVYCVEKSKEAFSFLEKNKNQFKTLNNKVSLINQDVESLSLDSLDLIVANPPYIDPKDIHVEDSVRSFEPPEALFAKKEGLYFIRRWLQKAYEVLKPEGVFFFEIGWDQGERTLEIINGSGQWKKVSLLKDLSGRDRIATGEKCS